MAAMVLKSWYQVIIRAREVGGGDTCEEHTIAEKRQALRENYKQDDLTYLGLQGCGSP